MPNHVSTLRILDYIMAGLQGLATILLVVMAIGFGAWLTPLMRMDPAFQEPGAPPVELFSGIFVIAFAIAGVILLVEAILFVVAGSMVAKGRGRILQTILAVLTLPSFPIGTAFGIYALWICWSHPESKAFFESERPLAGPSGRTSS